jgi:HEPN domain-containing protein
MSKKQTAVEWLVEQISSSKYFYNLMEEIESRGTIAQPNGILHQAKAMEKEQIIDAFVECWKENMPEGYECKQSAEYYYNETFGSVD